MDSSINELSSVEGFGGGVSAIGAPGLSTSDIEAGSGSIFDNPESFSTIGLPDTSEVFENPFNVGPVVAPKSFEDPLARKLDVQLKAGPSFEAQTAPGFFDWEGSNAERYTNSEYYKELGFNPTRDNETLYGHRQTWGNTFSNAFAGMGMLAWNTFWEGWKGWGDMVNALVSWDASKLMGSTEDLEELDKEQHRVLNKYAIFRTPEGEDSLFSREFLGDMIQQSGFAIGALAQFATEELLTMGVGAAFKGVTGARALERVAKGFKQSEATLDMKRLGDVPWKGKTASKLYEGLKFLGEYTPVAGNLIEAGLDLGKAAKGGTNVGEVVGITLNGLKRTMAEANMAFTESRMEAAGTYGDLKRQLWDETIREKGDVSLEDQERIEDLSQAAAWSNFKMNAGVLTLMNRLQLGNMIERFRGSKAVAQQVENAIAEKVNRVTGKAFVREGAEAVGVKAGQPLKKVYEKGALGTFGNLGKIAKDFGRKQAAWEATSSLGKNLFKWELMEGVQELIQEGSNTAIKDYYADLYHGREGNMYGSVDEAIEGLKSLNGLKTFLMGAVTGRLLAPINKGFSYVADRAFSKSGDRAKARSELRERVDLINDYFTNPGKYAKEGVFSLKNITDMDISDARRATESYYSDPLRYAPESVANLKVQNKAAEIMEAAVKHNDQYVYEHAKDGAFAKAVMAAKKLNMLPSMLDTLRAYGDHFNEQELKEAYGADFNDSEVKDGIRTTVKEGMNFLAQRAQDFSDRYDALYETYDGLIRPDRYKNKEDRAQALLAKRALEDVVEWIASNEYRAKRTAERRLSIMDSASKLESVGDSAYMAFRILGDDASLQRESDVLAREIGSMEGGSLDEESKVLLERKKEQRAALEKLRGNVHLFEALDRSDLMSGLQEEESVYGEGSGAYGLMDAVGDYFDSTNKVLGVSTRITPRDKEDVYFKLRDYRRLHKDGVGFMDVVMLLGNRSKSRGMFLRSMEGLSYLQELQKKAADIAEQVSKRSESSASMVQGDDEKERIAKEGVSVEAYRGFKVGDKVMYSDGRGPFRIERISTTRVELLNSKTNGKEQVSLDKFDEMIKENKVKLLEGEEYFGTKLDKNKTLLDGKQGIYVISVNQQGKLYYMLTDSKEHVLDEQGDLVTGGKAVTTYGDKGAANEARDKIIVLRGERLKEEGAAYVFDGKELRLHDILVKDGERYEVMTSKAPEVENGKAVVRLRLLGGKDSIVVDSLAGYELASELAGARILERKGKVDSYRLKERDVLFNMRGIVREGEDEEAANRRLEEFIRGISGVDFLEGLRLRVSRNANWKKDDFRIHSSNKHLQLRDSDLVVELLHNGNVIGTIPHYASYHYVGDDEKVVELSKLTKEQYQEIVDVSDAAAGESLKEAQLRYKQSRQVFSEFYQQLGKSGSIELKGKAIGKFFQIGLFTGEYAWRKDFSVALKDLKYSGVDGKVVLLVRGLERGVKNKVGRKEQIVTEGAMTDVEREALLKRIERSRSMNGKDVTEGMGSSLAVVELPNKELRFVPLAVPVYEEKELDELVKELNERISETKAKNVVMGANKKWGVKEGYFNTDFNGGISERLLVSVSNKLEVSIFLNAMGNVEVVFYGVGSGVTRTILLAGKDAKSGVSFGGFKDLLAHINKGIEVYDSKQPDAQQRIDLKLGVADFKKPLSGKPDFELVKGLLTPVDAEVVKGGFVSLLYNPNVRDVLDVQLPESEVPAGLYTRKGVEVGVVQPSVAAPVTGAAGSGVVTGGNAATPAAGTTGSGVVTGGNVVTPATSTTGSGVVTPVVSTAGGGQSVGGSKVDELKKLTDEVLPEVQERVYNSYVATGMTEKEALAAMAKDKEVLKVMERMEQLTKEIKGEVKAYKVAPKVLSNKEVEDIGRFTKWVETKLPRFVSVEEMDVLRENLHKQGITIGEFVYSMQTLSEGKKGVIRVGASLPYKYHEAFHAVFRLLLSDREIERYLEIAKKEAGEELVRKGSTLLKEIGKMRALTPEYYEGLSDLEMERRYYEEYLADRFDGWMMDVGVKTAAANKHFFRRILDWIAHLFKGVTMGELEGFFYEINAGKYRDAGLAVNQFTSGRLVEGNTSVAPKAIEIGTLLTKDEDGNAIEIKQYLPEEKGSALAASIAAIFQQRMEAGVGSADVVMEGILDDYARLYDKENEQYLRYLRDENTRRQYFKMGVELDKLKGLFTTGREVLKEAVEKHLQSVEYLYDLEEEHEEDVLEELGDRATQDYKKSKERFGGFGSLSKWLRQYISTTTYEAEDAYKNVYLKEGERLLQSVDANVVYSGILKAVAGFDDVHKVLLRMREFGRGNEQSRYFIDRFFADMGVSLTDEGYSLEKEEMKHKFMLVMKGFQQYTPDYLLFNKNVQGQETRVIKANRRLAGSTQFSRWYNGYVGRFEYLYLQLGGANRAKFMKDNVSGLELFISLSNGKPISDAKLRDGALQISNELKDKLGISFHPLFIEYSLACARTEKHQSVAQRRLVEAFGDVFSIKKEDAEELLATIESGRNPFAIGGDVEAVEKLLVEEGTVEEGDDMDTIARRLMRLANGNSIFDETLDTTSFRNAEGELVYAHQLPTYHLVRTKALARMLAKGAPVGAELSELLSDDFLEGHGLIGSDAFRTMAGDMEVNRIEGLQYGTGGRGVTYGKFTAREMMVSLFELFGVNKLYGVGEDKFYSSRHLIRVIEATNTGDTVNLPVVKAVEFDVFDGIRLSKEALDILVKEVKREYDRIGRVKEEIRQLGDERAAYEQRGIARTLKEVDGYHNTKGLSDGLAKPRGLTLFKTGVMLGGLGVELEGAALREGVDFEKDYRKRIEVALEAYWMGADGKVGQLMDSLKEMDIIRATKEQGVYENVLLPGYMKDGFKLPFDGDYNKEKNLAMNLRPGDLEYNVAQVLVNDFINTLLYNQLLLGDQALGLKDFVDMVKRAKGANGSGASIAFDVAAPSLDIEHDGRSSHVLQLEDAKFYGAYSGKLKDKADAQMWMTVKSLRYTLFGLGKLNGRQARLLRKIENGEKVNMEEIFGKDGTISYDGQTNSLKMVYYDGKRYIKTSGFLLTKELASVKNSSGVWEARVGWEELHVLREKLEDYERRNSTICMAMPTSASKGEKANVAGGILPMGVVREDGKEEVVDQITDWNFQQFDNRYWRLQTENPSNKITITDPTQAKQLIMAEQDDKLMVEFMWDKHGGAVASNMSVGALKQLYRQQSAQRVNVKYRQARGELFNLDEGFKEIGEAMKAGKVSVKLAKFQERAIEVLRKTGSDSQLLEFFSLDAKGEPKYDLNHPVTLEKFTQLFMAYFSKGVMNEKIPGHAVTLVSNYGARVVKEVISVGDDGQPNDWRVVRRIEYEEDPEEYKGALEWEADPDVAYGNDEERRRNAATYRVYRTLQARFDADRAAGKKTYILDDLRHNVPIYKNGVIVGRYTEYMMAPHSAEAMGLMAEGGALPDVLAQGFGVRIPSQGKHSFVNLRLVDFLPAYYGSSGMFAPELIEISGADFDVDKLYVSIKDYYTRRREGKVEFVEYGRSVDVGDQYEEFLLYQKRSNRVFKQRYRELLKEHRSYKELKEKVRALRAVIKPFREAVRRGRPSFKDERSLFWTKHSVNILFDEIFGMDTLGDDTVGDLGELMDAFDRDRFLELLKGIEDRGEVNLREWYDQYDYFMGLVKQVDDYVTVKVLRELNMPETVEGYERKLKEEGEQHIGKLNNVILDAKLALQGNEGVVSGEEPIAYQVASVEPLEEVLEELKREFPVLRRIFEEGNEDVDSIIGKVEAYSNNKEGAENIGPAVNAMLAYSLLNTFGVELRKKNFYDKELWRFKLNGVEFNTYSNVRAYSGKDGDGKAVFEGERISHSISAIVSAMTDNAKERLAAKLGLNVEAVGLVSNLVAQGVPLGSAITFILQPVIQDYYRRTRNLRSGLKTSEEEGMGIKAMEDLILEELKKKLGGELKLVELTDEVLKENILEGGVNGGYEYSVFESFLRLKEQTSYFNNVSGVMKLAKGLGTSYEDVLDMQEKIERLKLWEEDELFERTNVPFDLRGVMVGGEGVERHHEVMGAYLGIFKEFDSFSKLVFVERTDDFKYIVDAVKGNFRVRKFELEGFHKRLKKSLICSLTMVIHNKLLVDRGMVGRASSLSNAMIHDREAVRMPEGFKDVVDVVRSIREELPDNYFVHQFLNVLPTSVVNGDGVMEENPFNSTGINKVEVNTWAKLNQLQIEKLQDSFLEIYQNDATRGYAWALFHYLLVKDGGQFRSGSFVRYVPNFMFKDLMDATRTLNRVMASDGDDKLYMETFGMGKDALLGMFIRGYLLNVNNRKYIAGIDLAEGKAEQVDVLPFGDDAVKDDSYVSQSIHFLEDGVLEVDMDKGVRDEVVSAGPVKAGDVIKGKAQRFTRLNDVEKGRLEKNKKDLERRGFWKGVMTVSRAKGAARDISVIRFPYVIKRDGGGGGASYYVLAEVDGKLVNMDGADRFLEGDMIALGRKGRYMPLEGLEGKEGQWDGAFVFGKLEKGERVLRERGGIVNNGGFSLEERRELGKDVEAALEKEASVMEAYDVLYDFQDKYKVVVRFEEGKGLVFEKNGKVVANQREWKEKYIGFAESYSKPVEEAVVKEDGGVVSEEEVILEGNGGMVSEDEEVILPGKVGEVSEKGDERISMPLLIKFLRKLGLIYKEGKAFRLSEEVNLADAGLFKRVEDGAVVNEERIKQVLSWFGLSEELVRIEDGVVLFDEGYLKVERARDAGDSNAGALIHFLRERFPQLSMEFVSEDKARGLFNEYQQKLPGDARGKLSFDKVNSFIYKGTVYLINGRVTDQVAIEEVLHPFVYTIGKYNPALFERLKQAAVKDFGELHKEIGINYSAAAGFTDRDRDEELVTQALARTFAAAYESTPPKGLLGLLNELKEWFVKLLKEFGAYVIGKEVVIDVRKLGDDSTFTDIAKLLNTYDSRFLVDTSAPGFKFSLGDDKVRFFNELKKRANPLQQKIIDDLIAMHNKMRLEEDSHTYYGEDGRVYQSMTTAISGKFDDEDELYKMNRLFGNDFDRIMESLVMREEFDTVRDKVKHLDVGIAEKAYNSIQGFLLGLTADGSVVLPQLRVFDSESGIAGTLDLLLIAPDGSKMVIDLKTSKKSVFEKSYTGDTYATRAGSRLLGEHFSKGQTHGIQVGGYKRLLEVNGHYVDNLITFHIKLDIEGSGDSQQVVNFKVEGPMEHSLVANKDYIDKIIGTALGKDKLRRYQRELGLGGSDTSVADEGYAKEWDEEIGESLDFKGTMEELTVEMESFREKLRKRVDRLDLVKNAASFASAKEDVHKLSELLLITGQDLSKGQADRAYGAFLNYAKTELEGLLTYLSDTSNRGTDEYIRKVLEMGTYLETYRGMTQAPEWTFGNKYQKAMLEKVLILLNVAERRVKHSLENYILDMMKMNSTRNISDEEWRALIREGTDISRADLYLGDIDTSTDPLVATAAKLYKLAMLRARDRAKSFEERIGEMGNRLAKLFGGKPSYSWMLELDEQGKLTGRYVQEIGPKFWKLYREKKSKLRDGSGKMMEYRKVYTGDSIKSAEDIAYNKRLMELKREYREFQQAEIQGETGVEDGDYYRYSQAFKDERDRHEVYKAVMLDGKFVRGEWVKRDDVGYDEYRTYQLKYYNFSEREDVPYYENGVFTGEFVRKKGTGLFVKGDYIEIRPIAGDGTDMRSEQWLKLQAGTDEKGRMMREFYDFFVTEMKETLKLLPLSTEKEMLGELPRVRGNFVNHAKRSPSFFKAAARTVGNWFNVETQAKESLYNEDGSPMNSIPVFYKGSLRDERLIEGLKAKLEKLEKDYEDKKVKKEDYLKEKEGLRNDLRVALSAVSASELETDMVRSLREFRSKAESFSAMHDIETSLLAVQEMLKKRKYRRRTASGKDQLEKGSGNPRRISGDQSRTLERFKEWMQMTFYHSDDVDMGKGDVIAKRLMNVSSIASVGVGAFGPIHNYVMGRINTAIETWGGRFYAKSAGFRAVKEFNSDFLKGLLRSDPGVNGDYYRTKRGRSKYEAMVNYFNITRKAESGEGKPKDLSSFLLYGYKLSEMGEFAAQSKSGIAVLMTRTIKNGDGKEISIYDAYDYNKDTGELVLKKGYVLDEKARFAVTNEIWEMNKQMHGNYAWEDRMVIQKYTLGQLAVQFHKWIYPMYKSRFKARYYDENLGDMEGRYQTVWQFIQYLRQLDGTLRERAFGAWKKMDKNQVRNMYRNAAELSFLLMVFANYSILQGVAEGLDDDDDRLKQWVNFVRWESSKDVMEMKFWIPGVGISDQVQLLKNPFAAGTTFTRFSSVLSEAADVVWPFNNDSMYYESGPNKGELKLGKKVGDLLPVSKEINRWASFNQVSDFFIQ